MSYFAGIMERISNALIYKKISFSILLFIFIIYLLIALTRDLFYPHGNILAFFIPGIASVIFAFVFFRNSISIIFGILAGFLYNFFFLMIPVFHSLNILIFIFFTFSLLILSFYTAIITFFIIKIFISRNNFDWIPLQSFLTSSIFGSAIAIFSVTIIDGLAFNLIILLTISSFLIGLINTFINYIKNNRISISDNAYISTISGALIPVIPAHIYLIYSIYHLLFELPFDSFNNFFAGAILRIVVIAYLALTFIFLLAPLSAAISVITIMTLRLFQFSKKPDGF